MKADLVWLGLDWDEGPDVGGPHAPYRQSERLDIYRAHAERLMAEGKAYPCFTTEEELDASRAAAEARGEGAAWAYDGQWRDADPALVAAKRAAGDPYTVRFKVPRGASVAIQDLVRGRVAWDADATVGDFVLLRSSGVPVYNFCVAVDDALMGITHVIRAEEHLTNTAKQGLVLEALGFRLPTYAHCSLILGQDRQKLSKRHGATSLAQFQQQGFVKEAMVNYLAGLGWNDGTEKDIYTVAEVVGAFGLDRVAKAPSMFDTAKLRWVNGVHLRALPSDALEPLVEPFLREAPGLLAPTAAGEPTQPSTAFVRHAVACAQEKVEVLAEAVGVVKDVLAYPFEEAVASDEASELVADGFAEVAAAVVAAFDAGSLPRGGGGDFGPQWKTFVKDLGKELGRKGKRLFHPLRLAVTGRMSGPDVGAQLQLLAEAEGQVAEGVAVALPRRMEALRAWLASA
jgi:glutamyl-tRNA synthetase